MAIPVRSWSDGETARSHVGRRLFGLAAILIGILMLRWGDFDVWQSVGGIFRNSALVYAAAAVALLGGLAMQSARTARLGALLLGGISVVYLLFCLPPIARHPLLYFNWGNLFEVFSQLAAALTVLGAAPSRGPSWPSPAARIGYLCFSLCVVSFTLGQLFYLPLTASFVPRLIPPGPMFWAIATTVAFGLAAAALWSGRAALLASKLLTGMLGGFAVLVWLPAIVANPHSLGNWTEAAQTVAIAAAAWVVVDYLRPYRYAASSARA